MLGFAGHAAQGLWLEFQAVERDFSIAGCAQAIARAGQALQRAADIAQLLQFLVGQGEFHLAIGIALRRIVAVLLQDLTRMFGTREAPLVSGKTLVQFGLSLLERRLQLRALCDRKVCAH